MVSFASPFSLGILSERSGVSCPRMLQHKAVAYGGLREIAVNHFVIAGFAIRLNEAQTSWTCSGPEEVVVSGLLPDNGYSEAIRHPS